MPSTAPARTGLRVIFGGTPEFAAHHLQALIDDGCQIVGVFTQPDRPAGRGKKLAASPVKELALAHQLPVFQPASLKPPESQQQIRDLQPDLFVVVAYGLMVPEAVLATPRHGCINVHASLLPRWRGAAPIQRAIEAGDRETGITIMQMDIGLDTGDMLARVSCTIESDETGGSLHDKLAQLGPPALLATLDAISANALRAEKQDDSHTTYASKISKQEADIDWQQAAVVIDRKVRAFNPFPVAFTSLDDQPLRIWMTEVLSATNAVAASGTVLSVDASGIGVACGEGTLLITEAQLAGKKRLPVADILRGNPHFVTVGQRFSQLETSGL
ncbi:MAG: methionyl-tRNA formyltransferase [Gammaproteobacteria bacterium BRH_c0]|nr:MAG: methionyl-tRNA formyltransferase [Gammaproteobacteria bacterium BRH_c0]